MIRSMTGYGCAQVDGQAGRVGVEVSGNNRKHLEVTLNIPHELAALEKDFRDLAAQYAKRGRVQVSVDYQPSAQNLEFVVDVDLARKYRDALGLVRAELGLKDSISLRDIMMYKDILSVQRPGCDSESLRAQIEEGVTRALTQFCEMREREGGVLWRDIVRRLSMVEVKVREVESLAPLWVQRYQSRLKKKMAELLSDAAQDEERILREAALMAERVDVTEEIVRLVSHIQQFRNAADSTEPVGRLLDFLVQEMLRESNTIASKSNDMDISRLSVEIRNELDKIREQIQNIE